MTTPTIWHEFPGVPVPGSDVCALDDIPDGGGRMFAFGCGEDKFRLLVLREHEKCLGYVNSCPHFGMPLARQNKSLIIDPYRSVRCNVHLASFRWQDGYCDSGDCEGASLVSVPLEVKTGRVVVST